METKVNNGGKQQPMTPDGKYAADGSVGTVGKYLNQRVSLIKKADKTRAIDFENEKKAKEEEKKEKEKNGQFEEEEEPKGYFDSKGRPIDYYEPIDKYKKHKDGSLDLYKIKHEENKPGDPKTKEDVLSQLKDYYNKALLITDNRFVDFDSFVEAYKNYKLNEDEYGRSAFMQMIKKQTDEGIRKRYIERNRGEFNARIRVKPQETLELMNAGIREANEQINNQVLEKRNLINKNNREIRKIKNLLDYGGIDPDEFEKQKKDIPKLKRENKKYEKDIEDLKSQSYKPVKTIYDVISMFNQNPQHTMDWLRNITKLKNPALSEEEKAMRLLLGTAGGN